MPVITLLTAHSFDHSRTGRDYK